MLKNWQWLDVSILGADQKDRGREWACEIKKRRGEATRFGGVAYLNPTREDSWKLSVKEIVHKSLV